MRSALGLHGSVEHAARSALLAGYSDRLDDTQADCCKNHELVFVIL